MLVNVYATHRTPPALDFRHQLRSRRDRNDPALGPHLQGLMGFVMGDGRREMSQMRYHVLNHLERVHHQLALDIEERELGGLEAWARAANAIVLTPDGAVCAPDGAILVAPDTGDAEPGAEIPYPADAVRRKQVSVQKLVEVGIATPRTLPPVVAEVEVVLRAPTDVARRCHALFACALRAESLGGGAPIATAELRRRLPLAFESMSPGERAFVDDAAPSSQAIVDNVWRYESLATLWWALRGAVALPFPSAICDAASLTKAVLAAPVDGLLASARLRPTTDILDALDLHYRLAWAVADAQINKRPSATGVESGVITERHRALNWLTSFQDADWDDVDTPT